MTGVIKERNAPCKNWPFGPLQMVRSYVNPQGSFVTRIDCEVKIAVARSDGSASISRLQAQGLESLREWIEPRLKFDQRYVGLAASDAYVNFLPLRQEQASG